MTFPVLQVLCVFAATTACPIFVWLKSDRTVKRFYGLPVLQVLCLFAATAVRQLLFRSSCPTGNKLVIRLKSRLQAVMIRLYLWRLKISRRNKTKSCLPSQQHRRVIENGCFFEQAEHHRKQEKYQYQVSIVCRVLPFSIPTDKCTTTLLR